jgi:hypothetical protein
MAGAGDKGQFQKRGDILLPSKHFEIYFPRTMKPNAKSWPTETCTTSVSLRSIDLAHLIAPFLSGTVSILFRLPLSFYSVAFFLEGG